MKKLLAACIVAAGFAAAPSAQAFQGSGFNFYNQCGNAFSAGFANRAFCHDYLIGYVDALVESGDACPKGVNDVQVVMVVQNWLRGHPQYLQRRATYMIRNAVLNAWPCR